MDENKVNLNQDEYPSCKILGDGEVNLISSNSTYNFKIDEISALKIKILTDAQYKIGDKVNLKIRLDAVIFATVIMTAGKIISIRNGGYEILYINLPDSDRNELNELFKNTCNN